MSDTPTPVRLVVVGHTNAGKTSLLRTLTRDRAFGEISVTPATTRHVEAITLDLGEGLTLEFDDTPGFEDSMRLVDAIHAQTPDPRVPGPERLKRFLGSDEAAAYSQEAKALAQLMQADLALYVVDAAAPVTGKYLDELVLLSWSGRPTLVVLNFVAQAESLDTWRRALADSGLHNVVAFDTVVYDPDDEARLIAQISALVPHAEPHVAALAAVRTEERRRQLDGAVALIVDALIDCAALTSDGPGADTRVAADTEVRERRLTADLLALFRFTEEDYRPARLPIEGTAWQADPFDFETLRAVGLGVGGAAVTGAAAGATIDLVTGFTSLGLASAIGGAVGAGIDGLDRLRRYALTRGGAGRREVGEATLKFLARRACRLVGDLAQRGHAAVTPLEAATDLTVPIAGEAEVGRLLDEYRHVPAWADDDPDTRRRRASEALAPLLRAELSKRITIG